ADRLIAEGADLSTITTMLVNGSLQRQADEEARVAPTLPDPIPSVPAPFGGGGDFVTDEPLFMVNAAGEIKATLGEPTPEHPEGAPEMVEITPFKHGGSVATGDKHVSILVRDAHCAQVRHVVVDIDRRGRRALVRLHALLAPRFRRLVRRPLFLHWNGGAVESYCDPRSSLRQCLAKPQIPFDSRCSLLRLGANALRHGLDGRPRRGYTVRRQQVFLGTAAVGLRVPQSSYRAPTTIGGCRELGDVGHRQPTQAPATAGHSRPGPAPRP
ncbi:MAG: hypothetical protein IIB77_06815, partial [Proteobacteria bacterium]|nr:hypothetical protein [Pseudomonadota bacterium]